MSNPRNSPQPGTRCAADHLDPRSDPSEQPTEELDRNRPPTTPWHGTCSWPASLGSVGGPAARTVNRAHPSRAAHRVESDTTRQLAPAMTTRRCPATHAAPGRTDVHRRRVPAARDGGAPGKAPMNVCGPATRLPQPISRAGAVERGSRWGKRPQLPESSCGAPHAGGLLSPKASIPIQPPSTRGLLSLVGAPQRGGSGCQSALRRLRGDPGPHRRR